MNFTSWIDTHKQSISLARATMEARCLSMASFSLFLITTSVLLSRRLSVFRLASNSLSCFLDITNHGAGCPVGGANNVGNNKRGPHFHNRKIQVALLKRESTHSPVTKNRKNPKRIANTTPFLSCVPYTNKHSLAKKLFSDRSTQTTNILPRILARNPYLNRTVT